MQFSDLWARAPLWWMRAIEDTLSEIKGDRPRNSVSAYVCLKAALVLSARANKDTGEAWPAQKRIAEDAGLSLAQVRRALAVLESASIICRRRRQRASTYYTVVFECAHGAKSTGAAADGARAQADAQAMARPSLECANRDQSKSGLTAQSASLRDHKCGLDYAHSERQTEQTQQTNFNQIRSVRAAQRENDSRRSGPNPSDALIESMRLHLADGSYKAADREARQALRTLGHEREAALIDALRHPKTRMKDNPIGFAISCVRTHGRVL